MEGFRTCHPWNNIPITIRKNVPKKIIVTKTYRKILVTIDVSFQLRSYECYTVCSTGLAIAVLAGVEGGGEPQWLHASCICIDRRSCNFGRNFQIPRNAKVMQYRMKRTVTGEEETRYFSMREWGNRKRAELCSCSPTRSGCLAWYTSRNLGTNMLMQTGWIKR